MINYPNRSRFREIFRIIARAGANNQLNKQKLYLHLLLVSFVLPDRIPGLRNAADAYDKLLKFRRVQTGCKNRYCILKHHYKAMPFYADSVFYSTYQRCMPLQAWSLLRPYGKKAASSAGRNTGSIWKQ